MSDYQPTTEIVEALRRSATTLTQLVHSKLERGELSLADTNLALHHFAELSNDWRLPKDLRDEAQGLTFRLLQRRRELVP